MSAAHGPSRTVVDAQVHIWEPETPSRPWVDGAQTYAHGPSFSDDQLVEAMDAAGVDKAVLIPPSWEGDSNDTVLAARRRRPDRFLVMGRIDVTAPMSHGQLQEYLADMAGLRLTFRRGHAVAQLREGQADWLWAAAERLAVPTAVYAPTDLDYVDAIAERHPGLPLAVDHLGLPLDCRNGDARKLIDDLCKLAVHPRVVVKASCLPNNFREPPPFTTISEVVAQLVDAFGYQRVFWGSDISRLPVAYAELVTFFRDGAGVLTGAARDGVLGASMLAWLGKAGGGAQ